MAVKDVFKVDRKTFFNPQAWIGYDFLKDQNLDMFGIVKRLFYTAKPQREENFNQAMERLGLNENDLKEVQKDNYFYAWMFLLLAGSSLFLSFYMLVQHGSLSGLILGLAVMILFLAQAFRYHFWYFQIKHRKLGCTFEEWRHGKIQSSKDTSL